MNDYRDTLEPCETDVCGRNSKQWSNDHNRNSTVERNASESYDTGVYGNDSKIRTVKPTSHVEREPQEPYDHNAYDHDHQSRIHKPRSRIKAKRDASESYDTDVSVPKLKSHIHDSMRYLETKQSESQLYDSGITERCKAETPNRHNDKPRIQDLGKPQQVSSEPCNTDVTASVPKPRSHGPKRHMETKQDISTRSVYNAQPQASVKLWHTVRDSHQLYNKCPFPDCNQVKNFKKNHNEAKHFFVFHMPNHLRHGDNFTRMGEWAAFLLRIMDMLQVNTLDDLFDKVRRNGWFPVNRSVEFTNGYVAKPDKRMVDGFAKYIGVAKPEDYSETNLGSLTLLVNWRVVRCIMLHGLDTQQRHDLRKTKETYYFPSLPRRR